MTNQLEQPSKVYRPFAYPWAVELAVRHEKIHWVEQEVSLEDDIAEWKRGKVSEAEKTFITQVLRLFTQSDVAVGSNYYDKFLPSFRNNEVRGMLGSFAAREAIHQRAYALLNDSLGLPEGDYAAFLEYAEMADKIDFMLAGDVGTLSGLGHSLAKAVFNEGVSLFASFIMLLTFQRRGLMKGMGKVVEWSIRDETLHVEGVSKLFRTFCEEHPRIVTDEFKKAIYNMAKLVVALEDKFIELVYQDATASLQIEGLTADEVKKYIRYLTDRRLIQLGLRGNYKIKTNPIPWTETIINAVSHDNFFETRVTEYEAGGMKGIWEYSEMQQDVKNAEMKLKAPTGTTSKAVNVALSVWTEDEPISAALEI